MAHAKPRRFDRRMLLAALGALAVAGLLAWGVSGLLGGKTTKAPKPPKISLLPDKPPPPPPKEEKKPEPPKPEQKTVQTEAPRQPIAQNEPLKMEGAAGDGPSPFAAGAVNREYQGGSIGGRMMQGLYADRLQRHLQQELNRNRKLRESDYRVTLRVWLNGDGSIQRAELEHSTGNDTLDGVLRQSLLQIAAMHEAPPENMPQPIRIRVTARGTT